MEPQTTPEPKVFTNFASSANTVVPPVPTPPVPPVPQAPAQPPVSPAPTGNLTPEHNPKRLKILLSILLLLLVLVGAYSWLNSDRVEPQLAVEQVVEEEEVTIERAEMISATAYQAPSGFPQAIPVEPEIFESVKMTYNQEDVEQYTVKYLSQAAAGAKWDEYNKFLTDNDYTLVPESTDKSRGIIYGLKDNTGLLVNVSSQSGTTTVELNYFRKL